MSSSNIEQEVLSQKIFKQSVEELSLEVRQDYLQIFLAHAHWTVN